MRQDQALLANIKAQMVPLKKLLAEMVSHWGGEDGLYRFYHRSFKVYRLQLLTRQAEQLMIACHPLGEKRRWDRLWQDVVGAGLGLEWVPEHNSRWREVTLPIVTAFMHQREIIHYMVKYGEELEEAPNMMPSGWALVLTVFSAWGDMPAASDESGGMPEENDGTQSA